MTFSNVLQDIEIYSWANLTKPVGNESYFTLAVVLNQGPRAQISKGTTK